MDNGFCGYHPYVIFFYYICTGFLVMYVTHPLFLGVALLILIGVNVSHDKGSALKKWAIPLVAMSLIFILLNPFLVSRGTHILFYFRGKQVTLEALIYGATTAASLVSILVMFISFNLILNGNKFLYICSKVLPRTAFLLMLAIRFVPLLKRRFDEIAAVQRVRGTTMTVGRLRERARNGMHMIQILLTWSLEEAVQTADSMKSRGYGSGKKSSYIAYRMEKRDWIWLLTMGILLIVCIVGGMLGYGKIIIYPALGTLHLYPLDWVLFIFMIILLSFPLLVEGREWLKWKS